MQTSPALRSTEPVKARLCGTKVAYPHGAFITLCRCRGLAGTGSNDGDRVPQGFQPADLRDSMHAVATESTSAVFICDKQNRKHGVNPRCGTSARRVQTQRCVSSCCAPSLLSARTIRPNAWQLFPLEPEIRCLTNHPYSCHAPLSTAGVAVHGGEGRGARSVCSNVLRQSKQHARICEPRHILIPTLDPLGKWLRRPRCSTVLFPWRSTACMSPPCAQLHWCTARLPGYSHQLRQDKHAAAQTDLRQTSTAQFPAHMTTHTPSPLSLPALRNLHGHGLWRALAAAAADLLCA